MQGVCWDLDGLFVLLICLIAGIYISVCLVRGVYDCIKSLISGVILIYCYDILCKEWCFGLTDSDCGWPESKRYKCSWWVEGLGCLLDVGHEVMRKTHDAWLCRHTFGISYIGTLALLLPSVKSSNVSLDLMWILYFTWELKPQMQRR